MTNNKYVMVSLDDAKLGALTDVLSNKTSKKILEYLAEKEASESEIASDLNLPANTVNYNVKKLLESGLIEKSKNYFWSIRGKKIAYYRVAKKSIIISPKSKSGNKNLAISLVLASIGAFFVKIYTDSLGAGTRAVDLSYAGQKVLDASSSSAGVGVAPSVYEGAENLVLPLASTSCNIPIWPWFLLGAISALLIYTILNWRRL